MRKKILMIYTGGTIGMKRSEDGFTTAPGYLEEELEKVIFLDKEKLPEYTFMEYSPLLDSSNISVEEWNKLARDIKRYYDDYDGFVILHGTDTMAYTGSALSFMLENLNKPVILTGSQIPIGEMRSDAKENIITALLFAADPDIAEVCVYFGGSLLRGNRSTKISADDMIAFDSPNYPLLAEAGIKIEVNKRNLFQKPKGSFEICEFHNYKIAILKVFPGISEEIFTGMISAGTEGLVVEGFGSGNMPDMHKKNSKFLSESFSKDVIIVICTQCLKGGAILGHYAASKAFSESNASCGYDMTAEAAVAKLYYLLSKGYDKSRIKRLMEVDIRGEITNEKLPIEIG